MSSLADKPRSGTSEQGISAVVPTRGNPHMVARLLTSLRCSAQDLPPGTGHEVIVVDDSEGSDKDAIVAASSRTGARYVRGPRRVGAKRNVGVSLSRYSVILFIDSDCVATPGLLCAHLQAHATPAAPSGRPVGAVAGPTVVDKADTAAAWRIVKSSVVVNSPWSWPAKFQEVWWAATSNLSVRREVFTAVGGFDPHTYTVVGGEDVDFGVRLHAAGYTTVCAREAVVSHEVDGITTLGQFRRKLFLYGRACVYNCARQPEHAKWSANPVSLLVMTCAASLVVPRGRTVRNFGTGAVAAWFGAHAWQAKRRERTGLGEALGVTSVDWSFHLGIAAEAVARGRLALAVKRFNYFPEDKFVPAPPDDSSGASNRRREDISS
ncbi:glycosyltransferase [Streptomyces sp. NBS 14/10]|uniref:glycosyltransferase family 2 protein n=1 Tax=Streptomyces sp. NBS 14/10 TaxID=1945643 RepID=UPI00211B2DD5|nr:glycosyltransferase [Streptomyces sp. NBS 14/10]KAK1186429.1 glycosyltransferase [Streptomyces sp. NBS 14/10]